MSSSTAPQQEGTSNLQNKRKKNVEQSRDRKHNVNLISKRKKSAELLGEGIMRLLLSFVGGAECNLKVTLESIELHELFNVGIGSVYSVFTARHHKQLLPSNVGVSLSSIVVSS